MTLNKISCFAPLHTASERIVNSQGNQEKPTSST